MIAFYRAANDNGTYFDYGSSSAPAKDATTALRNFEMADTRYVAVGGETCSDAYSPQNNCEPSGIAKSEFEAFHYSFLNAVYNLDVNNNWVTGGCMDSIKQKLGYRFVLRKSELPLTARANGALLVGLTISNIGYASPYNARPVQLILRNQRTGKTSAIALGTDIRTWFTGTVNLRQRLILPPDVTAGSYDVLVNMPDNSAALAARPEFSIQLANAGIWEPTTGYNKLKGIIEVK